MSMKEVRRRNLASKVLKKAWQLYKKFGAKWAYSFGKCLKLAWKIIRGFSKLILTTVKGVTYVNPDTGISRQKIIKALQKYPYSMISLYFEREASNKFDPNAVQIQVKVGDFGSCQLGYLARDLAIEAARKMDEGYEAILVLEEITTNWSGLGVSFGYGWI